MPLKKLNFITGNRNKLAEVQAILGDTISLESQSLNLPEIQGSIEEIALDKCRRAAEIVREEECFRGLETWVTCSTKAECCQQVQAPVLVEDTCLCFNALNELPGPYMYVCLYFVTQRRREFWNVNNSKWFLEALGHEGLNNLLLAYDDKSAQAVCTFAYSEGPGHEPIIFEGRALGKIVPARGPPGFGWDPVFEYKGETYAEMEPRKKNGLSHRFLALEKMRDWFLAQQ